MSQIGPCLALLLLLIGQAFIADLTSKCQFGIFYLVALDLVVSLTLLIRTYVSSELRTSASWLFLLVGGIFLNAQVRHGDLSLHMIRALLLLVTSFNFN